MERTRPAGDAEVERTDRSGPVCAASVADGCGPEDGLILQTGGELLGQIFLRADGLYRVDMEGRAVLFPRTSDVPIYAGMEDPFLGG